MWVDGNVRLGVVFFDVLKVGGVLETGNVPVQVSHPVVDVGVVVSDHLDVRFEVLVVHRVETDDGGVQPHIRFCQVVPNQVPATGSSVFLQDFLHLVQVLEHAKNLLLIHLLNSGETRLVHTVVDVVIYPTVDLVDLGLQLSGVQVNGSVFLVNEVVEPSVEHSDDLTALVVDNGLQLLIPEHRHSKSAVVFGVGLEIQLSDSVKRVQVVGGAHISARGELLCSGETPSFIIHMPVHNRHGDKQGQPLKLSGDECSVSPRTSVRHIQVIAAGLRGKSGTLFGGNEVSELRRESLVGAVLTGKLKNGDFLVVSVN